MATYGYVRVSTRDQNEARQIIAMEQFGIDTLYVDKLSGKDFNRPEYNRMISNLKPDDVVVVKSIDRFGRNYEDILSQWRYITKEKHCAIVVLDMPLLDTRNERDLTGILISDIVLQLLSYVSETERAFINQRREEGMKAAMERGVKFGRPQRDRGERYCEVERRYKAGELTLREAGQLLGVAHTTFRYWINHPPTDN